ncbi:MAG: serine protein kinase RIO [Candidatus Hadarchaeales archaeon]
MSEDVFLAALRRHKPERLEKDSEIYKIMAGVFDHSTLLSLCKMVNRGIFDMVYGAVSTGKEANVFCASDSTGNFLAVKIYRIATSDFKTMHKYLLADPRYSRVPHERRRIIFAWTSREFKNLQRAYEAGVHVPRPVDHEKNILVMEFLGENGIPYPRMKDMTPENPKEAFNSILEDMRLLYQKAGLVHADLSEYNILITPEPYLIDFSMAIDIQSSMALEYLRRDILNISHYFEKLNISVPEPHELEKYITGQ